MYTIPASNIVLEKWWDRETIRLPFGAFRPIFRDYLNAPGSIIKKLDPNFENPIFGPILDLLNTKNCHVNVPTMGGLFMAVRRWSRFAKRQTPMANS